MGSETQQTPSPALPLVKGKGVLPSFETDSENLLVIERSETSREW